MSRIDEQHGSRASLSFGKARFKLRLLKNPPEWRRVLPRTSWAARESPRRTRQLSNPLMSFTMLLQPQDLHPPLDAGIGMVKAFFGDHTPFFVRKSKSAHPCVSQITREFPALPRLSPTTTVSTYIILCQHHARGMYNGDWRWRRRSLQNARSMATN
jgi:hypothetical protein